MEKNITNTTVPTTASATTTTTAAAAPTAPAAAPAAPAFTEEELCGSVKILDTVHLKNLVDDLSKLYGTFVCTKVARDAKVAAEKRLIEAVRANLDRYEG